MLLHPGEIIVWDPSTAQSRRLFSEHDNAVHSLAVSPDGNNVAALTQRAVIVIDMATGAVRWRADSAGSASGPFAYSQDGSSLFAHDKRLDAATGAVSEQGLAPDLGPAGFVTESVTARLRTSDGTWFAAGTQDGRVLVYTLAGAVHAEGALRHSGPVNALAFSADGRHLASAGGESRSSRRSHLVDLARHERGPDIMGPH